MRPAMRSIVRQLRSVHPTLLATNGDSGWGYANSMPWYTKFLVVDNTPDLDEVVESAARNASRGFGPDNARRVDVTVTRDGEVPITAYGRVITYGEKWTVPAGKALVVLSLHMPDTNKRR